MTIVIAVIIVVVVVTHCEDRCREVDKPAEWWTTAPERACGPAWLTQSSPAPCQCQPGVNVCLQHTTPHI